MCTSITMKTSDFYFGRNMDLDYSFNERIVITPRNFQLKFRKAGVLKKHYAFMGMAAVSNNYPLYADAFNEKGLCIAGLNFPDNAYYMKPESAGNCGVASFELIPWLLGRCSTVTEAEKLLKKTNITSIRFNESTPNAPLHWHIADKERSIVLEPTATGMNIYDNPAGVLTNNPPFSFQMANLSQYMNLTTSVPENCFSHKVGIKPFGKGLGSFGLPGDFSPASRFVKAAYLRLNSKCSDDEQSSISQFFHLLDSVSVVNGCINSEDFEFYETTYSACMNTDKKFYYYKTYGNSRITAINMNNENLDGNTLIEFPLQNQQQILWVN